MTNLKLPSFFFDQKTGYEKEIFIDYFLSWTLRCAKDIDEEKEKEKEKEKEGRDIIRAVQQYSKFVLFTLLKYDEKFKDLKLDNTTIKLVETEKQWKQIDLYCVVEFVFEGTTHNCILVFENKMYSPLKEHQLKTYGDIVKKHCDKKDKEYDILRFFIHAYPDFKPGKQDLHGFKHIHIYDISGALKKKYGKGTGNALFDEFWYNYI